MQAFERVCEREGRRLLAAADVAPQPPALASQRARGAPHGIRARVAVEITQHGTAEQSTAQGQGGTNTARHRRQASWS
jgi:hypothetical protein